MTDYRSGLDRSCRTFGALPYGLLKYTLRNTIRAFLVTLRELSLFDEGFESGQRLIPLLGDYVRVFSDFPNRRGIELEQVFAAGPNAVHDLRALQDAKMFGDSLPSQPRAFRELGD